MFLYQCLACGFRFISSPNRQLVYTQQGPQWQLFCPPCPNCMSYGMGYGNVQCLGEYTLAPMNVVHGQPVYDMHSSQATAKPLPKSNASSSSSPQSTALTVAKPVKAPARTVYWNQELSTELTKYIMDFFAKDEQTLALLTMVCKRYRTLATPLLMKFVPPLVAHGSAVEPLKRFVQNELRGVKTLSLAVDKFSADKSKDSIISSLIESGMDVNLMLGTPNNQTLKLLRDGLDNFHALPASDRLHKMHNKFWVLDRKAVITGSPNVSFSGLEGGNFETCIIIRSRRVARLFTDYLALLQSGNPFEGAQHNTLKNALLQYNSEEHQLKLAMAPVINITDFVLENLQDAVKITIRQFLISPKNRAASGKDILTLLCGMAKQGVDIEIYLDESQYESQRFVQTAVTTLLKSGCKVFVQKPVVVINANAEGLMHDKLILATLHNGVQRTLLGSAGFTIDVIANQNAENFICTDVAEIHAACLRHHEASLKTSPAKQYVLRT